MLGSRIALLVALAMPWSSAADTKALVKQANEAVAAGQRPRAVLLLKKAMRTSNDPELRCKVGLLYTSLRHYPQAHHFFAECDRLSKQMPAWGAKSFAAVKEQLAQSATAPLTLDGKSKYVTLSWFAADERVELPGKVWVPIGQHTVTSSEGVIHKLTIDNVSARTLRVREPEEAARHIAPSLTSDTKGEVYFARKPQARRSQTTPLILMGLGAASLIGGGIAHGLAASSRSELSSAKTQEEYDRIRPTFSTRRTAAISLYAVGAVSAGVGTYLFFRNRRLNQERVSIGGELKQGGATVVVTWKH